MVIGWDGCNDDCGNFKCHSTSITDGTTLMTIAHDTAGVLIDTAAGVLIDTTAIKAAMLATAMLAIAMLAIALLLAEVVVIMSGIRPKPSPGFPGTFSS